MIDILHNIFVKADIKDIEKQGSVIYQKLFDSHEIAWIRLDFSHTQLCYISQGDQILFWIIPNIFSSNTMNILCE